MPDLPANIGYGTVVGKFITAVGDSGDGGSNPDAIAASGTVTFSPGVSVAKNPSTSPPVTVVLTSTVCTLNSEGILIDPQGNPGVTLIATNDTDLIPNGWEYTVTVVLTNASMSFTMPVAVGSTTDLVNEVPVG